jgi:hypothetical protein
MWNDISVVRLFHGNLQFLSHIKFIHNVIPGSVIRDFINYFSRFFFDNALDSLQLFITDHKDIIALADGGRRFLGLPGIVIR